MKGIKEIKIINFKNREGLYGKSIACNIITKEESVAVCFICGKHIVIDSAYITDDGYVCEYCYENNYTTCDICGRVIHNDDSYTTADNNVVCESCRDEEYAVCESCGEWHLREDMVYSNIDDTYYCSECYSEIYTTCEVCGAEMYRDDAYWCDRHEVEMCEYCYVEECNNSSIHNYSYKPYPIWHKDKEENSKSVYFGLELEIGSNEIDNIIEDLYELSNEEKEFYFKEDGSLDSGIGVEIVLHPRTMRNFYTSGIIDKIYEILSEYEYDMPDGYGNHIHISRNALNKDEWIKFIDFFHIFKKEIIKISRRKKHEFNRWCGFYSSKEEYKDLSRSDRYYCVNINPTNTIEVRIFEGHNTADEVYANLQFIDVLLNMCRTENLEDMDSCEIWKTFRNKAKLYKELDNKLKSISL